MSEVSTKVSDLLGKLGVNAEVFDRGLGNLAKAPIAALKDLRVAYSKALVESNKFTAGVVDTRVNLPPFCFNPTPQSALSALQPYLSKTYFETAQTEHASADRVDRIIQPRTRRAAMLQRLINDNAHVRASFEKVAGGTVVVDGRMDGTISMREAQRKTQSATVNAPSAVSTSALTAGPASGPIVVNGAGSTPPPLYPPSPVPQNLDQLLMAMDAEVLNAANAMQNAQAQQATAGTNVSMGSTWSLVNGPLSSTSMGLGDSSDGSGTSTGALTGNQSQLPQGQAGQGTSADSVDVGTLELQQLLTKRDQMYDLVRQLFYQYNQNAMAAINNYK
jgi:hypothetical protein